MQIEQKRGEAGLALLLSGDLTIYRAREIQVALLEALRDGTAMTADLSEVQEIDAAGLQLLVALARSCRSAGLPLQFCSPSAAVMEALRWSGMAGELELPGTAGAKP